jgi:hypothetical protein
MALTPTAMATVVLEEGNVLGAVHRTAALHPHVGEGHRGAPVEHHLAGAS